MAYTIVRPENRDKWLELRAAGIGSSEVSTIMGYNPFETPYQLWRRKMGIDPPVEENYAMKRGHFLEDAVAQFYADATGREIIKRSAVDWLIYNNDKPYLRVSPDRTFWIPDRPKSDRNKGIVECKTTLMEVDKQQLPMHWFSQLIYQLGVAELEFGSIAWLSGRMEFDYCDLEFDADFFKFMTEEVDKFYTDNILGKQEPAAYNADDIVLKHPRHLDGKFLEADDQMAESIRRLKTIKEELAALDGDKKMIEEEIKMAMADCEAVTAPGSTLRNPMVLCTWRASKDSVKFDEKKFAKENPELYAQYQYTAPGSRRFLVK
ncbi:MAG: YqaJ viral recombinase family protein [Bacteroidales bacterium]|nr:YqaJ viral recombinase family protein [Bacteroidales bacterium]